LLRLLLNVLRQPASSRIHSMDATRHQQEADA
jgi:hypothetical protein